MGSSRPKNAGRSRGTGAIAQMAHLPVLTRMRGVKVVALCDSDRAKARALADRFGILPPFVGGTILMSFGYIITAFAPSLSAFAILSGLTIGLGSSASFAPIVADVSLWFDRNRGLAMSFAAGGSYVSGVFWPPVLEHFISSVGWRQTHIGVGIFCLATMLPLALVLRRRPVEQKPAVQQAESDNANQAIGLPPNVTHGLLTFAGLCCCVAMSMPQVHLVAWCVDLGYGPARGAEMLSLMLAAGIVSRLVSGAICDRIGGLRTLLLGSVLQGIALLLFLPFDGMVSLYVVSAMFGLFQGGIVPS